MANVDPVRRAEIGREKRARTRAQLIAAAHALFARQAVDSVTVDDVVKEAGLAKGTFYVHFTDLRSLTTEVADTLLVSASDAAHAGLTERTDPAARIAFGCCFLIDKALADPGWAKVLARLTAMSGNSREIARRRHRLFEDLSELSRGLPGGVSPDLSLEIIAGILLQLADAIGDKRLSWRDRDPSIAAILRALGADARQVKTALASLPAPQEGGVARAKPPRRSAK